jgi:tripartite-type tricarboxylate transporter receptor subunit TctC
LFSYNQNLMTSSLSSITRRQLVLGAAASLAASPALAQAQAQAPKTIKLVVPFPPGGSTDILARAIGARLATQLGATVIIENKGGAAGSVGAGEVARMAPDGATLMMGHIGTLAINPSIYPKLPYDPIKSFAPLALVARVPNVLVVNDKFPVTDFKGFIAKARAEPGRLNYASGGNGSAAHITFEYLKQQTGIFMPHIPYRGAAPAVSDVLGGQVEAIFTGSPALIAHIRGGKLRPLAVSSPKRMPALPDVPTVAESGRAGRPARAAGGALQQRDQQGARLARGGARPGHRRRGAHADHTAGLRPADRAGDSALGQGDPARQRQGRLSGAAQRAGATAAPWMLCRFSAAATKPAAFISSM